MFPVTSIANLNSRFCWDTGVLHTSPRKHRCQICPHARTRRRCGCGAHPLTCRHPGALGWRKWHSHYRMHEHRVMRFVGTEPPLKIYAEAR